jgi:hypothetical protein
MFVNSVKLYSKFSNQVLGDEISNGSFFPIGNDLDVDLLDNGLGYIMKHNQSLSLFNLSAEITNNFSLGFWLYSINQGQVLHPDTGDVTDVIMPVISFFSANNVPVIEVLEGAQSDGKNYLTVKVGNTYFVTTKTYIAEVFHFIYIVWKGDIGSVTIFIDGKEQILTPSGSLVRTIDGSVLDVFINALNETGFNITQNTGYIDDIVLFNDSKDGAIRASNAVNNSVEYIVDASLVSIAESGQSFLFIDPATVRTTSIVDDLNYIYAGRDDGKIKRASPLFWEVRKVFVENKEANVINETVLDNGEPAFLDRGFLKISSSTVRL